VYAEYYYRLSIVVASKSSFLNLPVRHDDECVVNSGVAAVCDFNGPPVLRLREWDVIEMSDCPKFAKKHVDPVCAMALGSMQ